ncbi:sigma-54 dependent transcriptional regulator [Paracoccaceae bacterium]|nr:sigma-54 dependent transcriptional regulator [Paracoccaceae bacterium]
MSYILVVDDEKDIRDLISQILFDEGHLVKLAHDSNSAMHYINTEEPSLIILDIWLKDSDMDGIEILKAVKQNNPHCPVVVISGHGNIEIAVAAVKQGAYDFIEKPFNIDQLLLVIDRAVEASNLRKEVFSLQNKEINENKMVGETSVFKILKHKLSKLLKSNGRILISGPSGSGKEIAARFVHQNSQRANNRFLTVACASIVSEKMEELLFGQEIEGKIYPGLFEKAHGGTIFFDEVADLPIGTQSKILRVLVDQVFNRVGGKNVVRVNCRIISSTSKDLSEEIKKGNFKEELFHRFNVVPIKIPSLEERLLDIPILSDYFIAWLSRNEGLPHKKLNDSSIRKLQNMKWPGNIRQLKNTIERALILGSDKIYIKSEDIYDFVDSDKGGYHKNLNNFDNAFFSNKSLRSAREEFERAYLKYHIGKFGGNVSKTAHYVGMERSALHRKMKLLKIENSDKEK